jgi:hypothetical protein
MKPTIVTSCWSATLPPDYAPIGISRGVPRRRSGYRRYRALEPGAWFTSVAPAEFVRRYNQEVLGVLRAEDVVEQLLELAGDRIPALLCWEGPRQGSSGVIGPSYQCGCRRN